MSQFFVYLAFFLIFVLLIFFFAKKDGKEKLNRYVQLSIIGGIITSFILSFIISYEPANNDPTFYDTGNFEDMTEDELNDYFNWKEKQDEKAKILK